MSETPLPPPSGSSPPPPPPPPPNLTAPPGYVGYQPSPMSSVPLKRVGGIARAAMILVAATGALSIVTVAATRLVVDDAEAFLADEIGQDEFLRAATPYALLSFLQGAALVASAIVVIVWMHRIASNHRRLHRGTTWGPGWAIGGWFTPPLLFVIPFLVLREMWKASDPDVPVGGEWRTGSVSPVLVAWFVVFGPIQAALQLSTIGDTFAGLSASEDALAEQITGELTVPILASVADAIAAILFVELARRLTRRHQRLTGEHRD